MDLKVLKAAIRKDEGFRAKPYRCSAGKLTIGYGRNLDDRGITLAEAEELLDRDVRDILQTSSVQQVIAPLDDVRGAVVANMIFNLGLSRFLGFRKMLSALTRGDYEQAAEEMKDSRWYHQVRGRARRLVEEMRTGKVEG